MLINILYMDPMGRDITLTHALLKILAKCTGSLHKMDGLSIVGPNFDAKIWVIGTLKQ